MANFVRPAQKEHIHSAWNIFTPLEGKEEYELYHVLSPRSTTPVFHSHDFFEFYFFIAGDASVYIEEYTHRLYPGDVILFPPGYMHRAYHHNTQALYERMLIYIPRNVLRGMGAEAYSLIDILDSCIARAQYRFSLGKENFEYCRFMIHEIIRDAIDLKHPSQSLINRCKVNLLMTMLCGWFEKMKEEEHTPPVDRVGQLITFISAHLSEEITLDRLSDEFHVNKYHLMHEFKHHTNTSIYQFILAKRINLAKLLLQSDLSPSDTAARCGFNDYSGFYKIFLKETGLSPNQYLFALKKGKRQTLI